MNSRDVESALLSRCAEAARDSVSAAGNQREANVFRLVAMAVQSRFPAESQRLRQVSEQYFAARPCEQLSAAEVVGKGWVINLPRLRDMLSHKLNAS